ncbi:MAG: gliding motility-associated C-terminal domain-containing protein, partial [Bacteroidia bacterium]
NCPDTSYQTVIIEPDFMFYVPNAFTPNDDGVNDTFIGKGMFINEFEMMIFDRWGNMVYKTDNMDKPWDGRVNNGSEPAQKDVYIYSISVTNFKMEKFKYKGTVTLTR